MPTNPSRAGLDDLIPGRVPLVARCLDDMEAMLLEKREQRLAIKLRGRWYAVNEGGGFIARLRQADGTPVEITGTIRQAGGCLTVDAVETTAQECKRWHATTDIGHTSGPPAPANMERHIVLLGTAHYSFLDGPTETPLRIEVDLVDRSDGRVIVLPPALTTNRGQIEVPIASDGSFSYKATDGTVFKVNGRLSSHSLNLVVETAGSIGWTRKELSAAL